MSLKRAAGVESEELPGGEVVVVRLDTGVAVVLNPMGGIVWELCDGCRGPAEIAQFIGAHARDAVPAAVASDVEALVQSLRERGFVEDCDPCGPPASTP